MALPVKKVVNYHVIAVSLFLDHPVYIYMCVCVNGAWKLAFPAKHCHTDTGSGTSGKLLGSTSP